MTDYLSFKKINELPRIPLTGNIDLTYRCNNDCRHCWVRISPDSPKKEEEFTLKEIMRIVDQARGMGCRQWSISGGEPMLRADFADMFDYIVTKSTTYRLNTNGTLITPVIAKFLKRKGTKMVALYGDTAAVHDNITRTPGSFEACLQGLTYLKEAGAGFIVQLIPMRSNYQQFSKMVQLAESLSPHWRIGSSWLYLSASGNFGINREIGRQRLDPGEMIEFNTLALSNEDVRKKDHKAYRCGQTSEDNRLFKACVADKRNFHIDPYCKMSFCTHVVDPALRYDLRDGNFRYCWEEFIPSLTDKIVGTNEYLENCGYCNLKKECRWCPAYAYLEHRRFSAKVEYLCAEAKEHQRLKNNRKKNFRYYQIADITIQVASDLPITDNTFQPKFKHFEVDGPGTDTIFLWHHFSLSGLNLTDLGKKVYQKPPWAIYRKDDVWIYTGISNGASDTHIHQVVFAIKIIPTI